jgi:hypothetical protein
MVIMTRPPYRCVIGLMIKTDEVSEQGCPPRCAEGPDLLRDWQQSLQNDLYVAYTLETGLPIRWVYVRSVYPELEFSFILQWHKVEKLAEQSSKKRETRNGCERLRPFAGMACREGGELI